MATKRRAQPKKRPSAKHRSARAAIRRGGGLPPTVSAVLTREPPVIADTATSLPPGAVLFDAAEGRVLVECPPWEVIAPAILRVSADAPRETSNEDFGPIPLTRIPSPPRIWLGIGIAAVFLGAAILIGLTSAGAHG